MTFFLKKKILKTRTEDRSTTLRLRNVSLSRARAWHAGSVTACAGRLHHIRVERVGWLLLTSKLEINRGCLCRIQEFTLQSLGGRLSEFVQFTSNTFTFSCQRRPTSVGTWEKKKKAPSPDLHTNRITERTLLICLTEGKYIIILSITDGVSSGRRSVGDFVYFLLLLCEFDLISDGVAGGCKQNYVNKNCRGHVYTSSCM